MARASHSTLVLGFGQDEAETFELAGQVQADGSCHYRLVAQSNALGQRTELQYRHPQGQLSDILSGPLHVCTGLDAQGRIQSLWLVENGKAQRQLASYSYAQQADGSSDLVSAQDEHEQVWHYGYLVQTYDAESSAGSSRQGEYITTDQYDPLGRRIAKLRCNAAQPGHSLHTLYGWQVGLISTNMRPMRWNGWIRWGWLRRKRIEMVPEHLI